MYQETDEHIERILAYYEWQKLMWHKSPKECRYIFQRAFSDFLVVLQCRKFGIGLPHDNCLLNIRTKFVKYWKAYFICKRNNLTYEEYYVYKEGHLYIYPDVAAEYEMYFRTIEYALSACAGAVYYGCERVERASDTPLFQEDTLLDTGW
jgi:hypothetical protein